ncbi:MAG TPA: CocE/NonD family hydrolase [Gaiellaceae bacterium]|nr:CocE/NonD family hydrolase [Gaiellaceae bacterium]
MGRFRVLLAVAVAVLVCGGAASAAGTATQELTITVSDGTKLACGLVLPAGSAPADGWPGVLLFHGLGQNHQSMETIASAALAPAGFASLMCDARGTGASGGAWGLDGPSDVQDVRDLFNYLAARSDVSDTQIGGFGLSLGGGAVWNAAVAGVPFKAIVPAITWTDLGAALNPNAVPKSGEIAQLASVIPTSRWDPSLLQAGSDLLNGSVSAMVKSTEAARSSRTSLHSLTVPTLLLQGRHDFLFDIDQALAAYRLLAGPKRLYVGDLGHPPATNPSAELPTYLGEAVAWFEKYVVGNEEGPPSGVELAHDPWDGTTTKYQGPPPTRRMSVNLPGTKKLATTSASTSRSVRLTGGPLETFGDGSVTVRYSGAQRSWVRLVATVGVKGSSTPVTFGAALLKKASGVLRIPLSDQAVFLPRGKRLVVTVGGETAAGVYQQPSLSVGTGSITIRRVTLNLSLLKKTVSR